MEFQTLCLVPNGWIFVLQTFQQSVIESAMPSCAKVEVREGQTDIHLDKLLS